MPRQSDFAVEMAGVRARRRRCRHEPAETVSEHRAEIAGQVMIYTLARCGRCSWLVERTQRFGPGSDGDSGWRTVS